MNKPSIDKMFTDLGTSIVNFEKQCIPVLKTYFEMLNFKFMDKFNSSSASRFVFTNFETKEEYTFITVFDNHLTIMYSVNNEMKSLFQLEEFCLDKPQLYEKLRLALLC